MQRPSGRNNAELRPISFIRAATKHAEGSVIAEFGDTRVLCTASVSKGVPRFMKGEGRGWITAEYGMLPRSTQDRMNREASRGKQGGRTLEIQRLIGRSLRAVVDLQKLGRRQIYLDCDVIQADGGTRTASITGAFIALKLAVARLMKEGLLKESPLKEELAAISVGIHQGVPVLDLCYLEDAAAEVDANFVMTSSGRIIEVQGTAEEEPFTKDELMQMLALAEKGIGELLEVQEGVC